MCWLTDPGILNHSIFGLGRNGWCVTLHHIVISHSRSWNDIRFFLIFRGFTSLFDIEQKLNHDQWCISSSRLSSSSSSSSGIQKLRLEEPLRSLEVNNYFPFLLLKRDVALYVRWHPELQSGEPISLLKVGNGHFMLSIRFVVSVSESSTFLLFT